MKNKLFLYSNVTVISGFFKSLIYDFFNQEVHSIQHHLIRNLNNDEIEVLKKNDGYFYLNDDITELVNYLKSNNLGYVANKKITKPIKIELYENPYIVDNIVLTFENSIDTVQLEKKLSKLYTFSPSHLSCYFLKPIKTEFLVNLLKILTKFSKSSISLNFKVNSNIDLIKIINQHNKIVQINIYGEDESFRDSYRGTLLQSIGNPKKFVLHEPNIYLYKESLARNTFFNKSIWINELGDISNQFNGNSFGNLSKLNLSEIIGLIKSELFQENWFAHKNLIDVCKDCEFRHICIDSRLPQKRGFNEWFHNSECEYNPYISKWCNDKGYKTLKECGVLSNENGFSLEKSKILEINQKLANKF